MIDNASQANVNMRNFLLETANFSFIAPWVISVTITAMTMSNCQSLLPSHSLLSAGSHAAEDVVLVKKIIWNSTHICMCVYTNMHIDI